MTDWIWKNITRFTYPTGSVRFWFDTWHDLAQVGGGSEQGLLNSQVEPAQWETSLGPDEAEHSVDAEHGGRDLRGR